MKDKLANLLIACPLCGRTGYTITGLRNHWCDARPGALLSKTRLTVEEWRNAVAAEQRNAVLERAGER